MEQFELILLAAYNVKNFAARKDWMESIKQYEFHDKLSEAEEREELVLNYLISLPYVVEVEDVRDLDKYRQKDIDFIVHVYNKNTKKFSYETVDVKTDTYFRTGNIFAEMVSNMSLNTKGCFLKTECDYIYYLFHPQNILYILPTQEVRQWFWKNFESLPTKKTSTCDSEGKVLYESLGKLIPRKRLVKEVQGVRVVKLPHRNETSSSKD